MGPDSESQDSDNGNSLGSSNTSPSKSKKMTDSPKIIGPDLPPSLALQENIQEERKEEEEGLFGPALPPHLLKQQSLHSWKEIPSQHENDDDDDDDMIGPSPVDHESASNSLSNQALELRARQLREKFSQKDDKVGDEEKREEWMTQLPALNTKNFGLGARKFKSRPGPEITDRSSWTDTPADKERKRKESAEMMRAVSYKKSKNEESKDEKEARRREKIEMKEKSRRSEKSLMQMHQEKLREKRKKEEENARASGASTRRPFDRDVDLKVNLLNPAQKKAMFSKSRELNSKFCPQKR